MLPVAPHSFTIAEGNSATLSAVAGGTVVAFTDFAAESSGKLIAFLSDAFPGRGDVVDKELHIQGSGIHVVEEKIKEYLLVNDVAGAKELEPEELKEEQPTPLRTALSRALNRQPLTGVGKSPR